MRGLERVGLVQVGGTMIKRINTENQIDIGMIGREKIDTGKIGIEKIDIVKIGTGMKGGLIVMKEIPDPTDITRLQEETDQGPVHQFDLQEGIIVVLQNEMTGATITKITTKIEVE